MTPRSRSDDSFESGLNYPARRRRGALLWSSHWFFLNRKQKRILFISVWARTRSTGNSWTSGETTGYHGWSSSVDSGSERFLGWEGASGAGARALGLTTSLVSFFLLYMCTSMGSWTFTVHYLCCYVSVLVHCYEPYDPEG
ncbi:hypothetical protein EV421DRAFT_1499225 [Armillaria borealis]|uniref:Uncharacterized protein n=1 Tax=Armillaria borealis TaxID=47425 RepID=A0AA39IXZ3_9AGAR|nr:hypothetical protein EV421DRAFT_1499225 [Armillaria borealis]